MNMNTGQVQGKLVPDVSFEDVRLAATEVHDAPASAYTICLALQGEARLSYRIDDRWHSEMLRPGMFAPITPPHAAATFKLSQPQRHLMISVAEDVFIRVAAGAGCNPQLGDLSERTFSDAFLGQLCRRAWAETNCGDNLGHSFASSVAATLVCGLLRGTVNRKGRAQTSNRSAGLSPAALTRIRDRCLDGLHEGISVAELAAVDGFDPRQFGRAFKVSTGQTPHQYLISLRTQRAQSMLRDTHLPIVEIALACGFYDQSHLTTTFIRLVGVSPFKFRQQP